MAEPVTIVCMGAGYVGGSTMAVIASRCLDVQVVVCDVSCERIAAWQSDTLPVHEPGLSELVRESRGRNLVYSTDAEHWLSRGDMIFVAVGTPTRTTGPGAGRAPLTDYVIDAAKQIARSAKVGAIVVQKSTVPPGTAVQVAQIIDEIAPEKGIQVLANPEFLAEGTAIRDLLHPDRVVIGYEEDSAGLAAAERLKGVYSRWVASERVLLMDRTSAEMCKLASNAFLAQRLVSVYAFAHICERMGANALSMFRGVGADSRIGPRYLGPAIAFGGSCFKKDVLNVVDLCERLGLPAHARYWAEVVEMNDGSLRTFVEKIVANLNGVEGKTLAVWGFAFKANSGDTRESCAIGVCSQLLKLGAVLRIYDPRVESAQVRRDLGDRPGYETIGSAEAAAVGATAIVLCTEWAEFKDRDFPAIYGSMTHPALFFDGRNIVDRDVLRRAGFVTFGIGVPPDPL